LKLDVIIAPTNGKNRLTFGVDPVPDTDSGSLSTSFTIAEYNTLGHLCNLRAFLIVTGRFSRNSPNDEADKRMYLLRF